MEVLLEGLWNLFTVNAQNPNAAGGEPAQIIIQPGQAYNADAPFSVESQGASRANAPLTKEYPGGLPLRGSWVVVAEIDHVLAISHRVTVVADKVGER